MSESKSTGAGTNEQVTPTFVTRKPILNRLTQQTEQILDGHGQILFVYGESGSGKTALMQEYTRQAQHRWRDLIVVEAACHAQTGYGDAYAPFREILKLLTGSVDGEKRKRTQTAETTRRLDLIRDTAQDLVVDIGPELVALFLPGVGFAAKVGAFAVKKSGLLAFDSGADQLGADADEHRVFEQYTTLLRRLSTQHPLVLVLDDLQWIDHASAALLFHLTRQLRDFPILLVGLYRPAEIALGRSGARHPLEKPVNECQRYFGDIFIDLDQVGREEGRRFVDELLDSEPNQLDDSFRAALFAHTEGQPLFTVEVLRNLQETGGVVRNAQGDWAEDVSLDWGAVPDRIGGVIAERVDRLTDELKNILRVAAVEGQDFTAQVVAQVEEIKERQLLRRLNQEVEQQHHLVQQQASIEVGAHVLDRFRFIHTIFQQHFYRMVGAEKRLLHREIGLLLEEFYAGRTDEVVAQLARHFEEAHMWTKAVEYWLQAGERDQRLFAYRDAIEHFQRAFSCAEHTPLSDAQALRAHKSLGRLFTITGQYEVARSHLRLAQTAAHTAGDVDTEAFVCRWMARNYENDGDYVEALAWVEKGLNVLGDRATDETVQLRLIAGLILLRRGDIELAEDEAQAALELAAALDSQQPLARAHLLLAVVALQKGYNQESFDRANLSLQLYTEIGDVSGQAKAHNQRANALFNMGQWTEASNAYQQAHAAFQRLGDLYNTAFAENNLGEIALYQGRLNDALKRYLSALRILEQTGESPYVLGVLHNNLGAVYIRRGEPTDARKHLDAAVDCFAQAHSRDILPEIHRHLAEIARQSGNLIEAEKEASEAMRLAEELDAGNEIAIAQRLLGELALDMGDLEGAKCIRTSLATLLRLNETYQAALSWRALARLDLELNRLRAAQVDLDFAEAIFEQLDAFSDILETQNLRKELSTRL